MMENFNPIPLEVLPKWVNFQLLAGPPDLLSAITYCFNSRGHTATMPPWPGVSFTVGTKCHALLFSTETLAAVAQMYGEH